MLVMQTFKVRVIQATVFNLQQLNLSASSDASGISTSLQDANVSDFRVREWLLTVLL